MNYLIFALGVNLLTLVNAVNDINFSTILKILKPRPRLAEYSNTEETNGPVEAIPIIPGFYLQKPDDLSKSLLENPKAWPDDAVTIFSSDATRQSKTNINPRTKNKGKRDDYLNQKILKAVRNLNKYKESQKHAKNRLKKNKHQHRTGSAKGRKVPYKKKLGRMFRGLKGNMYNRQTKKVNKKPQFRADDSASDAKVLGDLLKNIISGNKDHNQYPAKKKHAYRYLIETEGRSREGGDFFKDMLNTVQNNNQGLETHEIGKYQEQPTVIIISNEPLQDDDLEMENNAKESMETFDEDFDRSNSFYKNTRRSRADIGGGKSSSLSSSGDVDDSSYERNPGNPFTVHKNKYKQNWPYNHFMDGDHMNINPFGPQFGQMGPTGPELFFGRKWWYFNQDDFKPMG